MSAPPIRYISCAGAVIYLTMPARPFSGGLSAGVDIQRAGADLTGRVRPQFEGETMAMSPERTASACGALLGTNEIFVRDSVVTPDEKAILVRWAEEQRARGRLLVNPRDREIHMTPFFSEDRGLTRITKSGLGPDGIERRAHKGLIWVPKIDSQFMDPLPEAFWTIRSRVKGLLGLDELEEDYYKGSFLTYMSPGGRVHEHRDARVRVADEERPILRCNVLFKRPQQGGVPVIGSQEIDIPDRGMWAFYPTEFRHSTTVVRGTESRGNLSFGFLVRPSDQWRRVFRLAPGADSLDLTAFARGATIQGLVSRSLREHHTAVWQFAKSATRDFSVEEVAQFLDRDPGEIADVVRDLQEWRLLQSLSSSSASGTVLLFREVLVRASGEA